MNLVIEKLQQFVQNAPMSESSLTFIPFYDTILPMEKRSLLGQVKMSSLIQEKVKGILLKTLSTNMQAKASQVENDRSAAMLIKYRPEKSCDS